MFFIRAEIPCIENKLDILCLQYENIVLLGDLNSEMCEERINNENFKINLMYEIQHIESKNMD